MKEEIMFTPEMFRPVDASSKNAEVISRPSIGYWTDVWHRLKKNKLAMLGLIIIIILIIMAIIGPYISGYSYDKQNFEEKNMHPNSQHWFGTDTLGRDLFTRVWYGARYSLFIGFMAALLDFAIGVVWGGIAALRGGRVDDVMMRIVEILYSIPYLLIVILLTLVMPSGVWTIILALSITGWIGMARLVRGQVFQLKEMEYVQASNLFGAKTSWILRKHLIPNTMGPILVNVTLSVPTAIFAEATLSFLGLGIPAPKASWGTLANDALGSIFTGNFYQLAFPALFISLTMFAFNVFGDGLRDALDPKLRK